MHNAISENNSRFCNGSQVTTRLFMSCSFLPTYLPLVYMAPIASAGATVGGGAHLPPVVRGSTLNGSPNGWRFFGVRYLASNGFKRVMISFRHI